MISASVVQGSAVGPASFIIDVSDLHSVYLTNMMAKYADDMALIVGSNDAITIPQEMDNIGKWTEKNNLRLNNNKTAEIVFSRKGTSALLPCPIDNEHNATTLQHQTVSLTLQSNLSFDKHIAKTIASCASSLYALRVLRSHGLASEALYEVCRATTMAKLVYALPAWWGFVSAYNRDRLEALVRKTKRLGCLQNGAPSVSEMASKADDALFRAITRNPEHVLHPLLPPVIDQGHCLRPRPHNYALPREDNKNFIHRLLYTNIY